MIQDRSSIADAPSIVEEEIPENPDRSRNSVDAGTAILQGNASSDSPRDSPPPAPGPSSHTSPSQVPAAIAKCAPRGDIESAPEPPSKKRQRRVSKQQDSTTDQSKTPVPESKG